MPSERLRELPADGGSDLPVLAPRSGEPTNFESLTDPRRRLTVGRFMDGVIDKMFIEPEVPGDPYGVSDADTMLAYVAPGTGKPLDVTVMSRDGCPFCVRAKRSVSKRRYRLCGADSQPGLHGPCRYVPSREARAFLRFSSTESASAGRRISSAGCPNGKQPEWRRRLMRWSPPP